MLSWGQNIVMQKSFMAFSSIFIMFFKRRRHHIRRQKGPMLNVSQAQQHQHQSDSQKGQTPLTALVWANRTIGQHNPWRKTHLSFKHEQMPLLKSSRPASAPLGTIESSLPESTIGFVTTREYRKAKIIWSPNEKDR